VSKDKPGRGELTAEEISDAENHTIKEMKAEAFKEEFSALIHEKELLSNS